MSLAGQQVSGVVLPAGVNHNALSGVQGGDANDYNHLTTSQVNALHPQITTADTSSIDMTLIGNGLSAVVLPAGVNHDALSGLQGGASNDYNHLTTTQINALHPQIVIADTSSVDMTFTGNGLSAVVLPRGVNHNSLSGLQGGASNDYSHLTTTQINALHPAITLDTSATGILSLSTQAVSLKT